MQRKMLVCKGVFVETELVNIAVNDIDAKKPARCNRVRCKWDPVYIHGFTYPVYIHLLFMG